MHRKVPLVNIVVDPKSSEMVLYGIGEVEKVLKEKGIDVRRLESLEEVRDGVTVLVGSLKVDQPLRRLLNESRLRVPDDEEAFTISVLDAEGRRVVCVAGRGDRGTMYGAIELSEQLEGLNEGEDLYSLVKEKVLAPMLRVRGVNFYLVKSELDDERSSFHSEEFWGCYFDMMAKCRLNFLDLHALYEESSTRFINVFTFRCWLPYPFMAPAVSPWIRYF